MGRSSLRHSREIFGVDSAGEIPSEHGEIGNVPSPGGGSIGIPGTYPSYIQSLGPIGNWRLNEASGTVAYDEVGIQSGIYDFDVTLNVDGLLSHDSYPSNTAVDFNNSNYGRVVIPFDEVYNVQNLSILAWVKPEFIGGNQLGFQYIIIRATFPATTEESFQLIMEGDGRLNLRLRSRPGVSEELLSTGALQGGNIYCVAVTYDGSDVNFYIDGQPAGSSPTTISSLYSTSEGITLGTNRASPWYEPWSGVMDEIALFDRALSSTEVLTAYNQGTHTLHVSP